MVMFQLLEDLTRNVSDAAALPESTMAFSLTDRSLSVVVSVFLQAITQTDRKASSNGIRIG
jgi:hypothetical protein